MDIYVALRPIISLCLNGLILILFKSSIHLTGEKDVAAVEVEIFEVMHMKILCIVRIISIR